MKPSGPVSSRSTDTATRPPLHRTHAEPSARISTFAEPAAPSCPQLTTKFVSADKAVTRGLELRSRWAALFDAEIAWAIGSVGAARMGTGVALTSLRRSSDSRSFR
eukprot:scaffold293835_cov23-Tisochrysis_lutea.AAC.2